VVPSSPPTPLTNTRFPAIDGHASAATSQITGWSSRPPFGGPQRRRVRRLASLIGGLAMVAAAVTSLNTGAARAQDGAATALTGPSSAALTADRLSLRPSPAPAGKLIFPVSPGRDCYILDNFGDVREAGRRHEGLDITGSAGRPVYAVANGRLTRRYTNTGTAGWGWTLEDATTSTTYRYFHLAPDAVGLREGSSVTVGQILGYVGNSGTYGENNYHLHFEVRPNNVAIDPLPLLVIDRTACGVS